MRNSIFIFCFMTFGFLTQIFSQNSFTVDVKNYENDTLILGYYYGERTLVKDTLFAQPKGKFKHTTKDTLAPGMYILLTKPDNGFIQFLITENDKSLDIKMDAKDFENVQVKNSAENQLFYDYLAYLKSKRPKADELRKLIETAKAEGKSFENEQNQLDLIDKDVNKYQDELMMKHPKSITTLLINANKEVKIPEFEGTEEEVQLQKYLYYKEHYFDHINFNHPAILRTPFLHQRVNYYITKLTPQVPDSLIKSIDYILKKMEHDKDMYRYFLADFINKYAQMKIVGHDAIYVHLVDNYYAKGKAPWVDEETLHKMSENANDMRPILIGKKMPDFTTYKEDNTPVSLYKIVSPYTVVLFWAPDCGHCKKIMPDVVEFYAKNKDKGLKLFSVCTKGGDKLKTCWPAIEEKGMGDFLNTVDEFQRFNQKFKIKQTPKIFILDANKEIILKDLPAEELDRVFNEILKMEEDKKTNNIK